MTACSRGQRQEFLVIAAMLQNSRHMSARHPQDGFLGIDMAIAGKQGRHRIKVEQLQSQVNNHGYGPDINQAE